MEIEEIKKLCWIAWRQGSIGSNTSYENDMDAFNEWWEGNAAFLINNLPIPDNDKIGVE